MVSKTAFQRYILCFLFIIMAGCHDDNSINNESNSSSSKTVAQYQIYFKYQDYIKTDVNRKSTIPVYVYLRQANSELFYHYKPRLTQTVQRYPVKFPTVSNPFSLDKGTCEEGVPYNSFCIFYIGFDPEDKSAFFSEETLTLYINNIKKEIKILGIPETISNNNEASPVQINTTPESSLNVQFWNDNAPPAPKVSVSNNLPKSITDISLTCEKAPAGFSFDASALKECKHNTACTVPVTFDKSKVPVAKEGHYFTDTGTPVLFEFSYDGIKMSYSLGNASVSRYGKGFFVNPIYDLGNYNRMTTSDIYFTKKYGKTIVSGGRAGLFISTNDGDTWRHIPGITHVNHFVATEKHILIATNSQGLVIGDFNKDTGAISNLMFKETDLPSIKINHIAVLGGLVLISTNNGLITAFFNNENAALNILHTYKTSNGLPSSQINSAIFDADTQSEVKNILIVTINSNRLSTGQYSSTENTISNIKPIVIKSDSYDANVNAITLSGTHVLISTDRGLFVGNYHPETATIDSLVSHGMPNTQGVNHSLIYKDHIFMFTKTDTYVADYFTNDGSVQNIRKINLETGKTINAIEPSENDLFYTSTNSGLVISKYDAEKITFDSLRSPVNTEDIYFPGNQVSSIEESNNLVLTTSSTDVSLGTFDSATGQIRHVVNNVTVTQVGSNESNISCPGSGILKYGTFIGSGILIGGNRGCALNYFKPASSNTYTYKILSYEGKALKSYPVGEGQVIFDNGDFTSQATKGDFIYFSMDGGLSVGQLNQTTTPVDLKHYISLSSWYINSTTPLEKHLLVSSRPNGLYIATLDSGTGVVSDFKKCGYLNGKISFGATADVYSTTPLPDNHFIVSSSNGLAIFTYDDNTTKTCDADQESTLTENAILDIKVYKSFNGLPDDNIRSVTISGDNHLFMATDKGLASGVYDTTNHKLKEDNENKAVVTTWTIKNGLPSNSVKSSIVIGKRVLVATEDGIAMSEY